MYYKSIPHSKEDLRIKLRIDKIYTTHPEFGYRRICCWLNNKEHILINHKTVLKHMREMGIQAIYPRRNTSKPHPGNKIYP
ncbi:MAG: IS3 family transposase [Veillonellaceae bacterium]|nr:IS3 family transposase [Veillonellaceae bacterium]